MITEIVKIVPAEIIQIVPANIAETTANDITLAETIEVETISTIISSKSITVEIEPGKTLNINPNLTFAETKHLIKLLIDHKEAFAWDYMDMKGISSDLCTHHIILKSNVDIFVSFNDG